MNSEIARFVTPAWIQAPDRTNQAALLDFTRGVFRGLAFSPSGAATEIHTLRLRHAFAELGATNLLRPGLSLISRLREAEALSGGYWAVAPFRLLPVNDLGILIGAVPTEEMPFEYQGSRGLARLVARPADGELPVQSFNTWAGVHPMPPLDLVTTLRNQHQLEAKTTLANPITEYIRIRGSSVPIGWIKEPSEIIPKTGFALCRERGPFGARYFFGSLEARRLVRESPLRASPADIIPGLCVAAGFPLKVHIRNMADTCEVRIPRPVASAVRRSLALLSTRQTATALELRAEINKDVLSLVSAVLSATGYALEISE